MKGCSNVNEAKIRERYCIELLKSNLNKVLPTRTPQEYYTDKKIEILEKNKEYRENNKDK